ncbi:MAG: thioredoxin family protein [Flavobacterium sp.]|nr:MAG: thioredoxin family protein [Flavobacterium sp.]
MKFLILLLSFSLPIQWEADFEAAKKTAAEQHKLILLNFSGSDWCAPCMLMRKDYLESDDFAAVAKDRLVLVNADFPRRKKNALAADVVKRNDALAEKYNKQGNFPFTVLLDSNGNLLKSWTGKPEMPVEEWVNQIKALCDAHR